MEIKTEQENGILVVQVDGRIDGATAPEFEDTIKNVITDDERAVIVNFEGVSYISSAGLRAVLLVAKQLSQSNTKFALYSLGDLTREVFEISGFDRIIQIHGSKDEALTATGS